MANNRSSFPLSVDLDILNSCNLNCLYCYQKYKSNQIMDRQFLYRLCHEFIDNGVSQITIAGGEPFLYPHILDFIRLFCGNYGKAIAFISNGVCFSDKNFFNHFRHIVSELYQQNRTLIDLQISLDSVDPNINNILRGKTEIVIDSLKKLSQLPLNLSVATVVTTINLHCVERIIQTFFPDITRYHLISLKLQQHNLYLKPLLLSKSEIDTLKLQAKWLSKKYSTIKISGLIEDQQTCLKEFPGCPAAIFRYYIDHRGKVYPCCMAPSATIGDLSHEKFEKIVQKNLRLSGYQNNLTCSCQAVR